MPKLSSMSGTFGFSKILSGFVPSFNAATGGTISQVGTYAVHTFTATGTFTLTKVSTTTAYKPIYYCIVGGGAGGVGYTRGGAGGGVRLGNIASPTGSYSITAIGAAGAVSGSGGTTTFNALSATGGSTTTSGTPGGFTYGAALSAGGATVYGGGGGAGGKGGDGYLWNGVSNWPTCGDGGASVDFTLPDGSVVGSFGGGGGGGTSSPGQIYPGTWVWGPYIWNQHSGYGTGGTAAMVASTDPQLGFGAAAATTGTQGAVMIAYKNSL